MKKKPNETTTINNNENENENNIDTSLKTNDTPSSTKSNTKSTTSLSKQAPKSTLQDRTTLKRQPLAVISDTPHCVNMQPVNKPRLPAFVVLKDEDIDQGATEADQHSTKPSTQQSSKEESPTQNVPIIDTQATILTTLSSPVALASQDSFFGEEGGIEFRVDALDDDTEDEDNNDLAFFDDEEEKDDLLFLTKTYRRSHQPPAVNTTRDDSDTENKTIDQKDDAIDHKDKNIDQDTVDSPTLEFSVSNSVAIPLDMGTNYESDDTQDDQTAQSTSSSHRSNSSTTLSSTPSSDQPTLPMTLSFDDNDEVHVAYPFPRGKDIPDKFGA
ncbi:hypothetical protein BC941DRAFT_429701 [Chlamydoabsidia padenii]|nr:hypothetical protein BC941DRAFT_429701 [Chlamydoabsidia padenii]